MIKVKTIIAIGMLCFLLVGCGSNLKENVSQTTDISTNELCTFLCTFIQKTYAPSSQTDIDEAVGDAIGIIDTVVLFHYLNSLSKEIDKDKYVKITQVSYGVREGSSDAAPNIIVRFNIHLSSGDIQSQYIRFDLNDINTIIGLEQHFVNIWWVYILIIYKK